MWAPGPERRGLWPPSPDKRRPACTLPVGLTRRWRIEGRVLGQAATADSAVCSGRAPRPSAGHLAGPAGQEHQLGSGPSVGVALIDPPGVAGYFRPLGDGHEHTGGAAEAALMGERSAHRET